ncbi:hypothetical protein [Brucella intermedia]|uniref:hypothetical protein n=1 Tax=Brucella intermedia TaxID=94625 RepID=UPI0012DA7A65|nr:hypothetical protein [Brucella intermedia]
MQDRRDFLKGRIETLTDDVNFQARLLDLVKRFPDPNADIQAAEIAEYERRLKGSEKLRAGRIEELRQMDEGT